MKFSLTVFLCLILFSTSYSQDLDSLLIEYPFAEPGSKVTRGIYGSDDRMEAKDAKGFEDFVRATAVMVYKGRMVNEEYFEAITLREKLANKFSTNRFAKDVRFLDQPTLGTCTGFLIAPDMLVTAGHCINSDYEANSYYWVFDYTKDSDFVNEKYVKIESKEIYGIKNIIASDLDNASVKDYAVLRLNRKSDRSPYQFRTSGKIMTKTPVYTIGSPSGLPLKFAKNAVVKDNIPENYFITDIDTYPGNSGGPVFDRTGFIEGIHVRGSTVRDASGEWTSSYVYDPSCNCIKNVVYDKARVKLGGGEAHIINRIPYYILNEAIYSNLEYAIENNLEDRFNSWSRYNWIFNNWYTNENGRLELFAINNNNIVALESILNFTKDDLTDEQGRAFLDEALVNENKEALVMLLENGILADSGVGLYFTLLQNTIRFNKNDFALLLLNYGADINVKSAAGDTLLHLAAQGGNKDMIKMLLKSGLDVGARNKRKKRPEWTARKYKHKALGRYLKRVRKGKINI